MLTSIRWSNNKTLWDIQNVFQATNDIGIKGKINMSWPSQKQQHLHNSTYLCAPKFAEAPLYMLFHLSLTIISVS